MKRHFTRLALVGLAFSIAACIARSRAGPTVDRSVLSPEQFADGGFNNLYDVIQSLRSNWLNPRGPDSFASPTTVQVYVDGSHVGGVESLRAMALRPVAYIRYFDAMSATARWGLGHGAGVVYVATHSTAATLGALVPP